MILVFTFTCSNTPYLPLVANGTNLVNSLFTTASAVPFQESLFTISFEISFSFPFPSTYLPVNLTVFSLEKLSAFTVSLFKTDIGISRVTSDPLFICFSVIVLVSLLIL